MPTAEIYAGAKFTVKGWVENDACQVLDFLKELIVNGDKDGTRLLALIKRTAEYGVEKNKRKIRALENEIYEFKAHNTGRILFFYAKGQLIICSHGFTGKKGGEKKFIKKQIEKAVQIKDKYFAETGG
jgi:hypothetical protein